jgi:transcriptional regulator of acetoin/glycerol metabolism
MDQAVETFDDRRDARDARQKNAGIVIVYSVHAPAFRWGPLKDGAVRIGRAPEMGLERDARLSREHAEIAFDGDRWTVRDLGSRNGTFVDGKPIEGSVTFDAPPRLIRMGHTLVLPVTDGWPVVTARPMRQGEGGQGELVIGPRLRAALLDVEKAAAAGRNVLVTGESGTGKEIAAKAFHAAGPHAKGPFVTIGARALAEAGWLERCVQSARDGVLFFDELGEIGLEAQGHILRLLETQSQSREAHVTDAGVRFCFATNRDLRRAVAGGAFRADLLYRIGQPEVTLPPLRERIEEIPWLVEAEVARADRGLGVSAEVVEECMLRAWPGNVRELLAEVRRAANAVRDTPGKTLQPEHLAARAGAAIGWARAEGANDDAARTPKRQEITRARIEAAFQELRHATAVARALGVHRSHLYRLMKQHGVVRAELEPGEP